jgi:hypothetical protein
LQLQLRELKIDDIELETGRPRTDAYLVYLFLMLRGFNGGFKDQHAREAIRRHMQKIAGMFAQGDFSLPMFIHDTVPPGVEAMKHLKDQITYTAEKTARGAQVRIATRSPQA